MVPPKKAPAKGKGGKPPFLPELAKSAKAAAKKAPAKKPPAGKK